VLSDTTTCVSVQVRCSGISLVTFCKGPKTTDHFFPLCSAMYLVDSYQLSNAWVSHMVNFCRTRRFL